MLDFQLSEDQAQIVSAVARTLEKEPPDAGDRRQVQRFGELGWMGIALPEQCGGSGGTLVDGALVAYEFGRALASPDLLATQLAALAALTAGEQELARAFASGEKAVGFCLSSGNVQNENGRSVDYYLRTDPVAGYWRIRGSTCEIVDASTKERRVGECIDPSITLLSCDSSSSDTLVSLADPDGRMTHFAMILLSAMLAGTAESGRDLAVAYTKARKQFGRFIGEFQAIKHHCANMHLRARSAFAQTMHAAMLTAAALPGAELQAMAALDISASAAVDNGEMGVHVHGGMGFSEECAAHRYLKRAHVLRIIGMDLSIGLATPFDRLAASLAVASSKPQERP